MCGAPNWVKNGIEMTVTDSAGLLVLQVCKLVK